jgi:hypothetical protein
MYEQRRYEYVHAGARKTVQELDRGAGAGGGAAAITLGQRAGARAEHFDVVAQPAQERVEEGQRVDEVVDVRQTDGEGGDRRSSELLGEQPEQQVGALAIGVGSVLRQLLSGGGDVVVLGALSTADDLAALAEDVDLGELESAGVETVTVLALELAAVGYACAENAREVDGPGPSVFVAGKRPGGE